MVVSAAQPFPAAQRREAGRGEEATRSDGSSFAYLYAWMPDMTLYTRSRDMIGDDSANLRSQEASD